MKQWRLRLKACMMVVTLNINCDLLDILNHLNSISDPHINPNEMNPPLLVPHNNAQNLLQHLSFSVVMFSLLLTLAGILVLSLTVIFSLRNIFIIFVAYYLQYSSVTSDSFLFRYKLCHCSCKFSCFIQT